jgi:DNA-directed RNA polymerase specialized sigma24 family protein
VPSQAAADVDQEVFLTVFKKIRRFTKDGKPAAFRRWLYAITFFKVLEYWKDRSPEFDGRGGSGSWIDNVPDGRRSPDASSGSPPEGGPVTKVDLHRILESIRPDWCAFWQQVVEERPVDEVAKQLGIQPEAVETAVTRVSRHLREVALEGVPVRILLLRRVIDLIRLEFKDQTFQAFWMVAAEERSAQAAADLLGMPVSRVHTYKSRVLNRLKQELEALQLLLPIKAQVVGADGAPVTQSEVTL